MPENPTIAEVCVQDQATADAAIVATITDPGPNPGSFFHGRSGSGPLLRDLRLRIVASPLIGPIDLGGYFRMNYSIRGVLSFAPMYCNLIDSVTVAGGIGPDAVPLHPDWVRSIRDQCKVADVPFRFEGWGRYQPFARNDQDFGPQPPFSVLSDGKSFLGYQGPDGLFYDLGIYGEPSRVGYYDVGPERSGRLLDGMIHDGEIPKVP